MEQDDYLLIMDADPVTQELKNYFMGFHLEIVQKNFLLATIDEIPLPYAILINSSLLVQKLNIIEQLSTDYHLPLLVINDSLDTGLCIAMLEAGADDCVTKPLIPRELRARIEVIRRRILSAEGTAEQEVYLFAHCRLYPTSRRVFGDNNQELDLSAGEYDLLFALLQKPQHIFNRDFLSQLIKNKDLKLFGRAIDVQISRLRKKIELPGEGNVLIRTIRSKGYLLDCDVEVLRESELNNIR